MNWFLIEDVCNEILKHLNSNGYYNFNLTCKNVNTAYKKNMDKLKKRFLRKIEEKEFGFRLAYYVHPNGKKHDEFKKYSCREKKFVVVKHCFYDNGKLNGAFKEYDSYGKLIIDCFYKNGELDGKYYKKQHGIKIEANYKNGKLDGEYHKYHERSHDHFFYKNGIKHGTHTQYLYDRKTGTETYVEGKLHGICETYRFNGRLKTRKLYRNNVIVRDLLRENDLENDFLKTKEEFK